MSALDSVDVHQQLIQALIADLARRYPGESPRLVQTHISSVVLVGTEAYKLKRPVCYPFVDFSTLEKRRYFCEEELRINRRTAPDLYLEVIPITGTLEAPRIGASQGVCATPRIGASQGACATHAHTASVPAGALHEAVVAATPRGLRVDCKLSGLGYANFDPNSSAAVTVSREREI